MTPNRSEIQNQLESELGIIVTAENIKLPDDHAASESLTQVADFLFERGYLQLSKIPIKSGHKRYLINTEPNHKNGDEMFRAKEITNGLFIETHYNKNGIKRKIEYLIRIATE